MVLIAHVLELRDGSLATPMSITDLLDLIEEYMGTDARQYVEEWLQDEPEQEDDRLSTLSEHYQQVLINIRDEIDLIEAQATNTKDMAVGMEKIRTMILREVRKNV